MGRQVLIHTIRVEAPGGQDVVTFVRPLGGGAGIQARHPCGHRGEQAACDGLDRGDREVQVGEQMGAMEQATQTHPAASARTDVRHQGPQFLGLAGIQIGTDPHGNPAIIGNGKRVGHAAFSYMRVS